MRLQHGNAGIVLSAPEPNLPLFLNHGYPICVTNREQALIGFMNTCQEYAEVKSLDTAGFQIVMGVRSEVVFRESGTL